MVMASRLPLIAINGVSMRERKWGGRNGCVKAPLRRGRTVGRRVALGWARSVGVAQLLGAGGSVGFASGSWLLGTSGCAGTGARGAAPGRCCLARLGESRRKGRERPSGREKREKERQRLLQDEQRRAPEVVSVLSRSRTGERQEPNERETE
jgi:hypothetical protein